MDYITLEDVKNYLGITNNDEDYLLTRLISNAVDFCENYCNRKFAVDSYVDYFSGNNQKYHVCQQWPVKSVSAVSCENITINFKILDGRKAWVKEYFYKGDMNCSVSYQAGYDVLPNDLQQAMIELVAMSYKQKDNINLSSKAMAGETTSFIVKEIPDFVAKKLKPFRRVL